jgi:hypothetical protein
LSLRGGRQILDEGLLLRPFRVALEPSKRGFGGLELAFREHFEKRSVSRVRKKATKK